MKRCTGCGDVKPHDEFHRHAGRPDGLQDKCKVCRRDDPGRANRDRLYRSRHPERVAERRRDWAKRNPDRRRAHKLKHANAHPEKERARNAVLNAVRRGSLVKPTRCERCGERFEKHKLQGHHRDYSKPLEVEWLCASCHTAAHHQPFAEAQA